MPCLHCGWQLGQDNPSPALALGRILDGRYHIGQVLGHGGFGITYLAWDANLYLRLAIKEYLPRESAVRAHDGVSVAVFSGMAGDQFTYGLDRFIEEARTLARFDQQPGIVTVKNFFRTRGTGYCVMDYVEGITLRQHLENQPDHRISVDAALKLLMPVADALRAVHKEGLLHRDIAPDNIYLTQDGRIKLLDFGAARYAAGEHSQSLSIILKPGYSPEEQYRSKSRQGPWTDIYGLAATFYRAITGRIPPESLERLHHDDLVPPSKLGVAIPPEQEAVLLKALAVKAEQRYQDVAELQQALQTGTPPALQQPPASALSPNPVAPPDLSGPGNRDQSGLAKVLAGVAVGLAVIGVTLWQFPTATPVVIVVSVLLAIPACVWWLGKVNATHPVNPITQPPSVTDASTGIAGQATGNQGAHQPEWASWRSQAEAGDARAQRALGVMYWQGRGVAKNGPDALRWFRLAADQGDAEAQCWLGVLHLGQNDGEAVQWFQKAAAQGHAMAQYNLGVFHLEGLANRVAKDYREAAQWFRRAAEQGDADGQNILGWLYQEGLGVAQDDREALRWFRQAAAHGHAEAPYNLGWLYLNGRGVVQDEAEAMRWFRQGVELGDAEAQAALRKLNQ